MEGNDVQDGIFNIDAVTQPFTMSPATLTVHVLPGDLEVTPIQSSAQVGERR
jgi:hypothetical protein